MPQSYGSVWAYFVATALRPKGAHDSSAGRRLSSGRIVAAHVRDRRCRARGTDRQAVLGQLRFAGAGGELKLNEIMSMVLVCGMLALVTWRAPGFASDLLAASPTLGIAGVGQQMTSAVSTGATAVSGAATAGLGAAKTAASMVRAGAASPMAAIGMVTAAAAAGLRGKGALGGAVGGGGDGKASAHGGGQGGGKGGKPVTPTASKGPAGTA